MTKCIDLTRSPKETKKPIKFIKLITPRGYVNNPATEPPLWNNIELIAKNYDDGLDLMFAYDDNRRVNGVLYLGKWNDGFVV